MGCFDVVDVLCRFFGGMMNDDADDNKDGCEPETFETGCELQTL